jgi:methyl-accepting chemotaxis protein
MHNRRTKIVINQKFQQQYAVAIVMLTVLLTNLFIIFRSLLPSEQALELSSTEAWSIGIFELILVAVVWYGALKVSHKIAGPIFNFTRQLKAVGAGDLWTRISLRQGDMFQEEADQINAGLAQLQDKVEAVHAAAKALQQTQTDGGATDAQIDKLMTALAELRTERED